MEVDMAVDMEVVGVEVDMEVVEVDMEVDMEVVEVVVLETERVMGGGGVGLV